MNLYHHGIKGQKWGIRRFQNEDGSLTEAGKRRYRYQRYQNEDGTLNERGIKNYINKNGQLTKRGAKVYEEVSRRPIVTYGDRELTKKGLRSLNGDDYLKKGTTVGRFADKDVIDNKRKYVYLTDNDRYEYELNAFDQKLGFDSDNVNEYEYELKKESRIATAKTVLDHMIYKYGDTLVKDLSVSDNKMKALRKNTGKRSHR